MRQVQTVILVCIIKDQIDVAGLGHLEWIGIVQIKAGRGYVNPDEIHTLGSEDDLAFRGDRDVHSEGITGVKLSSSLDELGKTYTHRIPRVSRTYWGKIDGTYPLII